ncbi:hypothetical protein [Brumimicrobium aurantiacum]|uniref:Uncharacterized protein n=1 Tax=Brumimicrobium aurantiacum TaxID=1737063 RepID=A0A3E1EZ01_9FLAO|nr:hypothetical protein [Brumimicrobium aurantiacum]RFC54790.1 hypothetical protein DXU93_07340 [Brumimicrobium aurantiacum]
METQLKNQWIDLEEQYHTLLKEKVKEHNLKNTTKIPTPVISSQLIFCKDGIVIHKLSEPHLKSGISIIVNNSSIAEIKQLKTIESENSNGLYNSLGVFHFDQINDYNPEQIVEKDFEIIASPKAS